MNIVVTAGNTQTLIDQVRCITNIFTGRTGAAVALEAHRRGHQVTLLTSHPDVVDDLVEANHSLAEQWTVQRYRTFEDLDARMAELVPQPGLDALIHSAAVSDYRSAGVFAPGHDAYFDEASRTWHGAGRLIDMTAGKVKSDAPELWLRLVRTPKLVDKVRQEWGFRGVLVKFKLEVSVSDERLVEIAERSRRQSGADFMVANTLETASQWAFVGPHGGQYRRISRRALAEQVIDAVEQLHREARRG